MLKDMMMIGMRSTILLIMKSEILKNYSYLHNLKYFFRNECMDQCPAISHCEWGFCECDAGFTKSWGQCSSSKWAQSSPLRASLNHSTLPCSNTSKCQSVDINMVCLDNTCACRKDMKWNIKALECQVPMDDSSQLQHFSFIFVFFWVYVYAVISRQLKLHSLSFIFRNLIFGIMKTK